VTTCLLADFEVLARASRTPCRIRLRLVDRFEEEKDVDASGVGSGQGAFWIGRDDMARNIKVWGERDLEGGKEPVGEDAGRY
jgi:hypothetical protein